MGDGEKVSNYTAHDVHIEIIPALLQKNQNKTLWGLDELKGDFVFVIRLLATPLSTSLPLLTWVMKSLTPFLHHNYLASGSSDTEYLGYD